MRISLDEADPGYTRWIECVHNNEVVAVMLDGKLIDGVFMADDVIGEILCYIKDDEGGWRRDDENFLSERRHGKVEIIIEPRHAQ